jgi:hypothetical protein
LCFKKRQGSANGAVANGGVNREDCGHGRRRSIAAAPAASLSAIAGVASSALAAQQGGVHLLCLQAA